MPVTELLSVRVNTAIPSTRDLVCISATVTGPGGLATLSRSEISQYIEVNWGCILPYISVIKTFVLFYRFLVHFEILIHKNSYLAV